MPDYGHKVKYMNSFGFQQKKYRDQLETADHMPKTCFFWLQPNPGMTKHDLMWLNLNEYEGDGLTVNLYFGEDSEIPKYQNDSAVQPIHGQSISAD
mmetsp:Transcript_5131/g.7854  ORF Transcript_5131/g.7854 Transcript_5131/m.7854 type:complete len:96 (+) Transcript_5131:3122-3409(+)